jgi:hypothetical protein
LTITERNLPGRLTAPRWPSQKHDDPDWPGPLYNPLPSGKIISTVEEEEFRKKHLPESESWSFEELVKRWRMELND